MAHGTELFPFVQMVGRTVSCCLSKRTNRPTVRQVSGMCSFSSSKFIHPPSVHASRHSTSTMGSSVRRVIFLGTLIGVNDSLRQGQQVDDACVDPAPVVSVHIRFHRIKRAVPCHITGGLQPALEHAPERALKTLPHLCRIIG